MNTKTKLTPFARFFIFLLIILPLAYLGAAYYNGEDPVAQVRELVNGSEDAGNKSKQTYDPQQEIKALKKENQLLKNKIKTLEGELKKKQSKDDGRQKWGS